MFSRRRYTTINFAFSGSFACQKNLSVVYFYFDLLFHNNIQETVNIPDCYQDSRFDPGFDKLTGYHTKSLLTMPIVDFENETMGVLQVKKMIEVNE